LARCAGGCGTANADSVASSRVSVVLALEVPTRPAANSPRTPSAHPADGARECFVGRGANRKRVAAQTRAARLTKDDSEIQAAPATGNPTRRSALVDVSSQPCPSHRRLRLLHRGDGDVSIALYIGCDGARYETGLALQRDRASGRGVDASATSRSVSIGARVSVPHPRSRQHFRQGTG